MYSKMDRKEQTAAPDKAREIAIADYLNPVPQGRASPVGEESEVKYGHISPKGQKMTVRTTRFDSGVADLDHVATEIPLQQSPTGKGQRPHSLAKTYDYADYGAHQYEELPQTRLNNNHQKQMSPDSVDSHSSNGTTVTSGVHSEGEEMGDNSQNSEQRKRYNPLYDTMINSSPTIYNKVNEVAKTRADNHQRRQMNCLRLFIVLLVILSCTSLVLCVVLVLAKSQSDSDIETLKTELSQLKSKFTSMDEKMSQLERIVAGNKSFEYIVDLDKKLDIFESQTNRDVNQLVQTVSNMSVIAMNNKDRIETVYNNITQHISNVNGYVQEQMVNISKMPGPQGPQGVGNLSACYMKMYSAQGHESSPQTSTALFPTDAELQTKVVMFAVCSVEDSEYHNLHFEQVTINKIKYKCVCSGSSTASDGTRNCKLHLWMCPRES
ncbi:hypothetical protein FSP39_015775 [Pinctada imbricata]|uniref:Uncharacterized protein n=1 Tax=Pinctada imbricata TaxID=66713 RepID=A0AA89BWK6_PINIB|nr:hypothetical protein FSP39_015775 [Pinctada imbricata]